MKDDNGLHSIERSGMRGASGRRREMGGQRGTPPRRPMRRPGGRGRRGSPIRFVVMGAVAILVIIFFMSTTFSSGRVTLNLASTNVSLDAVVTATRAPLQSGDIPYKIRTLKATESFTTTDFSREPERTRATGTLTVFNTATTGERLDLVARTRFQTSDGKLYRLIGRQSIPGGKTVDGTFVAGSKDVEVEADKIGDTFNLEAGVELSIPGLAQNREFGESYGQTKTRIVGGFDGERFIPDEKEAAAARDRLREDLERKLRENLAQELSTNSLSNLVVFEGGIFITYESLDNEQTESSVILREEGVLRAIEFNERDFARLLVTKVSDTTVSNTDPHRLDTDSLTFSTRTEADDIDSVKEISFNVTGSARVYWDIDEALLKSDLAGEQESDAERVIAELHPAVTSVERASVFPFWRRSFPSNKAKISVVVHHPTN